MTRVADLLVTVRDYLLYTVQCTLDTVHCTLLYTVNQLVSQECLVIINHVSGNWGG